MLVIIGKWLEEVKREKTEEFKKSEGSAQLYNTLIDYTNGLKADIVIKKLQLIVSELKEKFDSETDITTLMRNKKNPKESAHLGKIIMFFASISKKVKQIKNLEKDFVDHKKMASYEMLERVYKLLFLYYKTLFYAVNNKLVEAYYICQTLIEEGKKAEEYYKVNAAAAANVKDKFFDEAMGVGAKAKRLKCLIHCVHLMRLNAKKRLAEPAKPDKAKRAVKYKDAIKLIEDDAASAVRLNSWVTSLNTAAKDLIMPRGSKPAYPQIADSVNLPQDPKKIRIVDPLPQLKLLHVKPYLHDVAGSLIGFPDFDAAIKEAKEKKGGLLNKIKWLFGR